MTVFAEARQDRVGLGIAMILLSWLFFSFVDSSVKWLVLLGLSAFQLAFMRYAVHFAISVAAGGVRLSTAGRQGALLLRAGLLASATFFNFVALNHLPLTVTSAIMFSSPIFVAALSGPLLGERVGPWRWTAVGLGFVGVMIVVRPLSAEFHWATLLVVYNAVAICLFSIITRRLAGEVPAQTMQLYTGAVGTAVMLPMAVLTWENPGGLRDWALLVGVGVWAWAGHEIFARAHWFAEASVLMPFTYVFILYMAVLGYIVFGDVPDAATILGAVIIVASGLIVWWRETRA